MVLQVAYGNPIALPAEQANAAQAIKVSVAQEQTLTGKLEWSTNKTPGSASTRIGLCLITTGGDKIQLTGPNGKVKTTQKNDATDLHAYADKQVKLTVLATEVEGKDGHKHIDKVVSLTRIAEASQAASPHNATPNNTPVATEAAR